MRPWWERNPAALDADIQELTEAGFRVRRQISAKGGLLDLMIEMGTQRFRVRYRRGTADDAGDLPSRVVVTEDAATGTTKYASGTRPLDAVRQLIDGRGLLLPSVDLERVLVPLAWNRLSGNGGQLELARSAFDLRVYAVHGLDGSPIEQELRDAAAPLGRAFSVPVSGLWVRGAHADAGTNTADEIVRSAERQLATFHSLTPAVVRARLRTEVGTIFQAPLYPYWQFVRRGARGEPIVLRTELVTPSSWMARAPYAEWLRGRRVTIIGCGAVGWSVAMQLARSGVKQFTLYDFDQMHLGNLARVGAFVNSVGRTKVGALAEQLEATVPGVRAVPIAYEVGIHVGPRALVADAPDLLINLSGERVSTDETNLAALALEKPALFAWVSNGVAAGRIFRVRPYQSPCYHCVREAGLVPIPSRGPVPMDPEIAWFGASFNVDAFAAAVARIAVLTLAGETVSATNPDHVVLHFGEVVPREKRIDLARDPRCAICGTGRPSEFFEWR
jgi:hypothetical protein